MPDFNIDINDLNISGQYLGKNSKNLSALNDENTLLTLHGWLDNSSSFVPLAEHLNTYTLAAVDLIGHGKSDWRPKGSPYYFINYVIDCFLLADKLKLGNLKLLGHSMGAGISTLMAGTMPDRVKKLCLIEGVGPLSHQDNQAAENLEKFVKMLDKKKSKLIFKNLNDAISARKNAGVISEFAAETIIKRNLIKIEEGHELSTDPRLKLLSPIRLSDGQIEGFVKRITAPTLLICSKESYEKGMEYFSERIKHFSNLKVVLMEGNHHLHLDIPKKIAETIEAFMQD